MEIQKKFNILTLFFLMLTILTILSCSDNKEDLEAAEKLKELQSELEDRDAFINELNDEFGSLNSLFDSIAVANDLLNDEDQELSKDDKTAVKNKIKQYGTLLKEHNDRIEELESQLTNYSTFKSEKKLLKQTIRNYKNQLAAKEKQLGGMKIAIHRAELEKQRLKKKLVVSDNDLVNSKSIIDSKNTVIKDLNIKSDSLKEEKSILEENLIQEKNKREEDNYLAETKIYFERGMTSFEQLDLIKDKKYLSKQKKERRKRIAEKAYTNFVEAQKRGYKEADNMVKKLLFNREYNAFLDVKKPTEN